MLFSEQKTPAHLVLAKHQTRYWFHISKNYLPVLLAMIGLCWLSLVWYYIFAVDVTRHIMTLPYGNPCRLTDLLRRGSRVALQQFLGSKNFRHMYMSYIMALTHINELRITYFERIQYSCSDKKKGVRLIAKIVIGVAIIKGIVFTMVPYKIRYSVSNIYDRSKCMTALSSVNNRLIDCHIDAQIMDATSHGGSVADCIGPRNVSTPFKARGRGLAVDRIWQEIGAHIWYSMTWSNTYMR